MSRRPFTDPPAPPPFPVGARVVYAGNWQIGVGMPPNVKLVLYPGAVGTIVRTHPGRRGTGVQCYDEDGPMVWEDTGEPILDDTRDGYSVWVCDDDPRSEHNGRIISPDRESLSEWRLL